MAVEKVLDENTRYIENSKFNERYVKVMNGESLETVSQVSEESDD